MENEALFIKAGLFLTVELRKEADEDLAAKAR